MSLSYQVSGALHRAFLVCGPSGVMRLVSLPTNTNKWDTARVVRSLCELYDDGFIGLAQILSDDFYRPVDVLASPDSTGQAFRCMVFSEPLSKWQSSIMAHRYSNPSSDEAILCQQ